MPTIEVDLWKTFEAEQGKRLVLALEENGIDVLHRCGGNARCTTCRVEFLDGEPLQMTVAEHDKLKEKELLGQVRLSCQITCEHDMKVKAISIFTGSGLSDPGPQPEATITPEPTWMAVPK